MPSRRFIDEGIEGKEHKEEQDPDTHAYDGHSSSAHHHSTSLKMPLKLWILCSKRLGGGAMNPNAWRSFAQSGADLCFNPFTYSVRVLCARFVCKALRMIFGLSRSFTRSSSSSGLGFLTESLVASETTDW